MILRVSLLVAALFYLSSAESLDAKLAEEGRETDTLEESM